MLDLLSSHRSCHGGEYVGSSLIFVGHAENGLVPDGGGWSFHVSSLFNGDGSLVPLAEHIVRGPLLRDEVSASSWLVMAASCVQALSD